jgi:hypothetical protein
MGHKIAATDQKRIKCYWCNEPATYCTYNRFQVGGIKGTSFAYHCDKPKCQPGIHIDNR